MPPKSKVSIDDAVNVLIRYMSYFASEKLPEWSSDVWNMMSREPEFVDKWKVSCIRTNVKEDRREILTIARQKCGYFIRQEKNDGDEYDDYDWDDDEHEKHNENGKCDPDYFNDLYHDQIDNSDTFDVKLSWQLWQSIYKTTPISGSKSSPSGAILQPKIWTDVIALEFWKQYRLKCAFVFKKGSVHKHGNYFATMIGRCKSEKCKNSLFAYIEHDPEEYCDVIIKMCCRDTRFEKHEDCKRPLQGKKRDEMKREVKEKGVKASIHDAAQKLLESGDTQCPIMSKPCVLYQLKKENTENNFGIMPKNRQDIINALLSIDISSIYRDSIKAVSVKPFWVFYATPSQIHCFREYRRLHRHWSSICIDATGGVVRKFTDRNNERTSAIFLYEIVVNFYRTSISVFQMLSEVHNSDVITLWLRTWCREVKQYPCEVVCDGSRALLNAISLAFNNRSLSDYIELCFNNTKYASTTQPKTYIRLDTAHFIHAISRWNCWKSVIHKNVKSFYLYCITLLIECEEWKEMEKILILILIICGTEYEDTIINYNHNYITPRDARVELETLIGNREMKIFVDDVEEKIKTIDFDIDKSMILSDSSPGMSNDCATIASWAVSLASYSSNITRMGTTLNCFYKPDFKDPLIQIIKEFPLWTKVCTPYKKLRPTSSYIEEDFKDLKLMLHKQISLPARVDIFVKAHLKNLLGGVRVFQNKLTQFVDEIIHKSAASVDDSNFDSKKLDLRARNDQFEDSLPNENWGGLGNDQKHANFDWLNYDNMRSMDENIPDQHSEKNVVDRESFVSKSIIHDDEILINLCNSIENDHNYSFRAHCPSSIQINKNDALDVAVEKVSRKITKEGKYFQDAPELRLINDLIKSKSDKENLPVLQKKGKRRETYLLINGNKSGPIVQNGTAFIVQNTCPFDSIIQLLFNGILESGSFREYLGNSENSAFQFVLHLMKQGVRNNTKIYDARFAILQKIYREIGPMEINQCSTENKGEAITISRVIDCEDNVTALWNKLFENEPSLTEKFFCQSKHSNYQLKKTSLGVNFNILLKNGISDLQSALTICATSKRLCPLCKGIQTCEQKFNSHIYIELDVRLHNSVESLSCKLKDFPVILNIKENGIENLCYRFCGAIGYNAHHYIAYCRRLSGVWISYNDLLHAPEPISCSARIVPHGALYLLEKSIE